MTPQTTTPSPAASMEEALRMPSGPWLLVVGMHRSGTSAVTGALGSLGFAVPVEEDRWEPSPDNPDHWESRALALHCDLLLDRLGGTWDRPPDSMSDAELDERLRDELGDPSSPAHRAFPKPGPVVWKDPRTCLLLPYWRAQLPSPLAAVFIWRRPLSVARSLQARDRMHLADGIALWERYNRAALSGLVGVDTFVTRYEDIVEDPTAQLGAMANWLEGLPQFAEHARSWDLAGAAASVSPELLRQRSTGDADLLLPEQQALVRHLESLDGPHLPLASSPEGAESPWTEALLGDRHQLATLSRQREELRQTARRLWYEAQGAASQAQGLQGEIDRLHTEIQILYDARAEQTEEIARLQERIEHMEASSSWRVTRPLRRLAALRSPEST
jgi:hypothetical protein